MLFTGARFALTRFANNTIHQNVERGVDLHCGPSARISVGARRGLSANQFDDASLRLAVEASENLARVQEPDPDLLPMPTAKEATSADEGVRATQGNLPILLSRLRLSLPGERADAVWTNRGVWPINTS